MGKPVEPIYDQDGFRARTFTTDPSINAAFNASDAALDANWTQTVGQLIRVRIIVIQTEGTAINSSDLDTEFILQYENVTAGGGFQDVGAVGGGTEDVDFISASFADGGPTTQIISSGTFNTGGGEGKDVNSATGTITFDEEIVTRTEIEFSIVVNSSQVTDADEIDLRVLYSVADVAPPATALSSYTDIPRMTVDKPAAGGPTIPIAMYHHIHHNLSS